VSPSGVLCPDVTLAPRRMVLPLYSFIFVPAAGVFFFFFLSPVGLPVFATPVFFFALRSLKSLSPLRLLHQRWLPLFLHRKRLQTPLWRFFVSRFQTFAALFTSTPNLTCQMHPFFFQVFFRFSPPLFVFPVFFSPCHPP